MVKADEQVLQALHPRVAVAFDFDETLAPSTTDALLEHLGEDPERFTAEHVQPLTDDGWETRLAQAHALRALSQRHPDGPITSETFAAVADGLELYPGVVDLFDRLRAAVDETEADVEVEFFLITAGFVDVPSHTAIADEFTRIIGGHWALDDDGGILIPKSTIGHYDKVRHLLAIAKGLDSVEADRDTDPDVTIPDHDWHVPFAQMVFVGDGDSDLPAFDLMESRGGVGVAVRQAGSDADWESREDMRDGREVAALATSDYREGSPALRVLEAAVRRAALRVQMLRAGRSDD